MSAGPVASKCNELVKGRISHIPCERPIIQFCNTTHRSNSNSGESDRDALNLTIVTYYLSTGIKLRIEQFRHRPTNALTILYRIYIHVCSTYVRDIIFHNLKRKKRKKMKVERQWMKHGVQQ